MDQQQSGGTRRYDAASAVVWFVGISQGVVPLVVPSLFDRGDRLALPLLLPDPWWWIVSAAVGVLAVVALLAIDAAKERAAPAPVGSPSGQDEREEPEESGAAAAFDVLSGIVLLVGIYNGLAPFVSRLLFGGDLFLAFTLRLPAPWWWLASLGVLGLTVVLLAWIDRSKKRTTGID